MDQQGPMEQFQQFLDEGKFMIQRGAESGNCFFYPRSIEPRTGATDIEWVEACGQATVYSTTVVRNRNPDDDYNLALIDLDEGPRLLSRVDGVEPDQVGIGMRVRSKIVQENDRAIVVFEPLMS